MGPTSDLSRRHVLVRATTTRHQRRRRQAQTYRAMAAEAIDRLAAAPGLAAPRRRRPRCRSSAPAPLVPTRRCGFAGPTGPRPRGSWRTRVAEPVVPGVPVTLAEIRHAFSHEGALTLEDAVARRVAGRLSSEVRDELLQVLADGPDEHAPQPLRGRSAMSEHHPFRRAVEQGDLHPLSGALDRGRRLPQPGPVPSVHRPRHGAGGSRARLVGPGDFEYVDEFASTGVLALHFTATIGDRTLEGIDLLELDTRTASRSSPSSCARCRRCRRSARAWRNGSA